MTSHRHIELDVLRSLAIMMMIVYHLAYDLENYYGWPVLRSLGEGGWLLARATATLFLLLVGISFAISWNRQEKQYPERSFWHLYRKYLRRGLGLILCGLLVTLVTYLYEPATYVRFGILHMIGVSILILPFTSEWRGWNLLIGIVVILLRYFMNSPLDTSLLLPIGIMPTSFDTVDYFPLIPWLGCILIGEAIGDFVYIRRKAPEFSIRHSPFSIVVTWPGRHALVIYLLHQPILLGLFGFLGLLGLL